MADFPGSHSTATAAAASVTARPYFDITLAKSLPGMLKIAQIGICFVTFCICAGVGGGSKSGWAAFVCFTAFVGAAAFFVLVVCHVCDLLPRVPWDLAEMVFYCVWTFFLFVSFCCMVTLAAWSVYSTASGFAAFFLIVCIGLFGFDAFLKFRAWRSSNPGAGPPPPVPDPKSPA